MIFTRSASRWIRSRRPAASIWYRSAAPPASRRAASVSGYFGALGKFFGTQASFTGTGTLTTTGAVGASAGAAAASATGAAWRGAAGLDFRLAQAANATPLAATIVKDFQAPWIIGAIRARRGRRSPSARRRQSPRAHWRQAFGAVFRGKVGVRQTVAGH